MKRNKIPFTEIFLFGFASMALNMIATFLVAMVAKFAIKPLGNSVFTAFLMWLLLVIICYGVPLGILWYYYMRKRVAFQYQPSENKSQWIKSATKLILPGEVLRFLLCLAKLGLLDGFGMLALAPSFLYEQTYLIWSGRMNDVRQFGNTIFGDYLAFTACYLMYAVIYIGLLLFLYRYYWKKESTACNEMLRHETDTHFQ